MFVLSLIFPPHIHTTESTATNARSTNTVDTTSDPNIGRIIGLICRTDGIATWTAGITESATRFTQRRHQSSVGWTISRRTIGNLTQILLTQSIPIFHASSFPFCNAIFSVIPYHQPNVKSIDQDLRSKLKTVNDAKRTN